ncbi:hypothetical protein BDA96_06G060000 [Sorghum bicolor]|uniref:Uncharacterized protein n=2 Tax=Sorghum bicolor TaxID=4558 RepID=A0A921UC80_SORBI|nr:hypothetical protein BDA96_06G060000 [Sorghum bicolor]OQU81409.1 hypothetical protein SORBI_3006G053550 [Sorghum bicolor]
MPSFPPDALLAGLEAACPQGNTPPSDPPLLLSPPPPATPLPSSYPGLPSSTPLPLPCSTVPSPVLSLLFFYA